MDRIANLFWTIVAALFLVEAWLWTSVGGALRWIVTRLPIAPLRHALDRLIAWLPPPAVLVLFAIPLLLLAPLKFLALAFIAQKRIVAAGLVYLGAKSLGVGMMAFVFDACRDKLLQMPWFRRAYEATVAARAWAHAQVAPYQARLRAQVAALKAYARARVGGDGRFSRKLARLRETMRRRLS